MDKNFSDFAVKQKDVEKFDKKIFNRRSDGSLERILKRKEKIPAIKILELGVVLTAALEAAAKQKKMQSKNI